MIKRIRAPDNSSTESQAPYPSQCRESTVLARSFASALRSLLILRHDEAMIPSMRSDAGLYLFMNSTTLACSSSLELGDSPALEALPTSPELLTQAK